MVPDDTIQNENYLQLENNFRDLEADFVTKVCNFGTQEAENQELPMKTVTIKGKSGIQ